MTTAYFPCYCVIHNFSFTCLWTFHFQNDHKILTVIGERYHSKTSFLIPEPETECCPPSNKMERLHIHPEKLWLYLYILSPIDWFHDLVTFLGQLVRPIWSKATFFFFFFFGGGGAGFLQITRECLNNFQKLKTTFIIK